jgi:hypothetical protein
MMNVELKGAAELVNRLSKFDKGVAKILTKEVNAGLRLISNEARATTPDLALSGWGTWNETRGTNAQRGVITLLSSTRSVSYAGSEVKAKTRPQFAKQSKRGAVVRVSARVVTASPAGAIFALAGSKSTSGAFKKNLNAKHGRRWPRVLSDALYAKGPDARKKIEQAIDKAARAVAN